MEVLKFVVVLELQGGVLPVEQQHVSGSIRFLVFASCDHRTTVPQRVQRKAYPQRAYTRSVYMKIQIHICLYKKLHIAGALPYEAPYLYSYIYTYVVAFVMAEE